MSTTSPTTRAWRAQLVDQPLSGLHAPPYPIGRARGAPADGLDRGERDRAAQLRAVRHRRDARRVREERGRDRRASTPAAVVGSVGRVRSARASARTRAPREVDRRRRRRARRAVRRRSSSGSDSSWVRRGVPTLLALIVYGFGARRSWPASPGAGVDRRDRPAGSLRRAGGLRPRRRGGADPRRRPRRARCRTPASRCSARMDDARAADGLRAPRHLLGARRARLARGARRRRGRRRARAPCAPACARRAARSIGAGIHPDGAFGDVVHVDEPRYHRDRRPAAGPHQAHADLRAARARRDARRRDRHPRRSTGCASSFRCCRRSPPTRPSGTGATRASRRRARSCSAATRAPRSRARSRSYDDYAATVAGRASRPATCPTTPSCGGTSARTRAWARSRCARWTASRRCGRRPALAALVHGLARAEAHEARDAVDAARGAHGGLVHGRARRPARAAADGRGAAARAGGRPRRAGARPAARRGARLGRCAGGHRADPAPRATAPTASGPPTPAAGCRRCWTCSWPRPRRPTDRRRRCRRS